MIPWFFLDLTYLMYVYASETESRRIQRIHNSCFHNIGDEIIGLILESRLDNVTIEIQELGRMALIFTHLFHKIAFTATPPYFYEKIKFKI